MRSIEEIDAMALSLRKELGEDFTSPIDIFSLAKSIDNLSVVFYPLGENISGMCIKNNGTNLIAINSGMSLGRQRFSLAHEFYHLKFDESFTKSVSLIKIGGDNEREKEADLFASHLLLPTIALYNALQDTKEISSEKVICLEQYFGMSRQAILYRLKSEGKIDNNIYNEMQTDVIHSALKFGYDTDLYKASNKMITLGQYIRLADELYNKEMISTSKYEEILLDAFRDDLVYGEGLEDELID